MKNKIWILFIFVIFTMFSCGINTEKQVGNETNDINNTFNKKIDNFENDNEFNAYISNLENKVSKLKKATSLDKKKAKQFIEKYNHLIILTKELYYSDKDKNSIDYNFQVKKYNLLIIEINALIKTK